MASLKEVADRAHVSMLDAYRVLKQNGGGDDTAGNNMIREQVFKAAEELHYELRITQIDVADFAGVAKGTVSYALNGNELIKAATRQKVLDAAELLGYRPNFTARNLRTNRSSTVGYSWHVADDPTRMNHLLD